MADMMEVSRLKNSKVLVEVVEALEDLLVVSFKYQERTGNTKHFQGVLLNSKKKNWPLGVMAPSAFPGAEGDQPSLAFDSSAEVASDISTTTTALTCTPPTPQQDQQMLPSVTLDSDRLYAVRRRHTYFQGTPACTSPSMIMSMSNSRARSSSAYNSRRRFGDKLPARTMRLRPRQVLCSKCKSICNENSENVQVANAFKSRQSAAVSHAPAVPVSGTAPDGRTAGVDVVSQSLTCDQSLTLISQPRAVIERLTLGPSKLDGHLQCGPPAAVTLMPGGRMVLRKRRIQNDGTACLHPPACPLANSSPPDLPQSPQHVNCAEHLASVADMIDGAPTTPIRPNELRVSAGDDQKLSSDDVTTAAEQLQALKQKKTSPFIKISFGPQGTVIKIPPRTHTYIASDNESDLQDSQGTPESGSSPAYRHFRAKAAKKALKKAKKDAQKLKVGGAKTFTNSPLRQDNSSSPSSTLLELTRKSRHHKHKFKHKRKHRNEEEVSQLGLGDQDVSSKQVDAGQDQDHDDDKSLTTKLRRSPEDDDDDDDYNYVQKEESESVVDVGDGLNRNGVPDAMDEDVGDGSAARPLPVRAFVENGGGGGPDDLVMDTWDLESSNGHRTDAYSKIKKECLRQKLSISLKRLSEKSYMKCSPSYIMNNNNSSHDDSNGSGGGGHSGANDQECSNESSEAGDLPEFPEISEAPSKDQTSMRPLMMRISSFNVGSFSLADGRVVSVGDVVWGKIHGFPWWPGKVLSIVVSQRDNGLLVTQQAHVAWFGSSTSSQMPCNQLVPFLEDFKLRYNKKKRGPYKEAIKQATLAAQQVLRSVGIIDST